MTGFSVALAGPANGRQVLLLHGFPQDLGCWDAVVELLAADGYRCARFDQRGYDPAVRPSAVSDYARSFLVADTVSVLDDLGWTDALLVGHDWGALVAWAVAAQHPERVSGLVAVSVPHPASFGTAWRRDPDQQERSAYIGLFRQQGRAEAVLLADGARRLRELYGDVPDERVEAYVARFSDPETLTAALSWYRAMDAEGTGTVGPITVPTRFLWGAEDVAVGRVAAQGCAAWVSADYAFVELPGVSHWVPETAPTAIAAAVRSLP